METRLFSAALLLIPVSFWSSTPAKAQQAPAPQTAQGTDAASRAEIYYDLTMGHLYETQYAVSNKGDDANQAIDLYKKAYALDPTSDVIGEQLAEMYYLAQRIRDAVTEAQAIINRDPDNVSARRLLSRIYLRSLGDLSGVNSQSNTVSLAIAQLKEIVRLDPTDTDSALWLARLYRLSNQPDQAETLLRSLLSADPENQEAAGLLTQLLLDEGKADEAIALLQQTLQRAPSGGLYDALGDAYGQQHDPARAEQAYRQAAQLEPNNAAHLQRLAQALQDQEKYQDAADQYLRLTEIDPEDPNNYLQLSEIYKQLHQLDKAEQQILLAKQHAPGSLEVIYNEATIYEAEERYDDAIRVLNDAMKEVKSQSQAQPSDRRTMAILYQLTGQIYRDENNYDSAINTFKQMASLGADEDRRSRALIVDTYRAGHDMPHAMAEVQQGLKDFPRDRGLLISQAQLYGVNSQPDQAAQSLRSLLDSTPADMEIYLNLAEVFEENKRFDDAEQALQSAVKFAGQPSDKDTVSFMLGGVYERAKKYDQAEQEFKDVIATNPRNAAALNYYGYMLADRGTRLDEAVSLLQRALAEEPNNPAYLDSMGWAYYKQNKLPQAEEYLRKATQHDPHDPTILSHLGDVLAKSGRADLAAAEWQKSLDEWHHALPADYDAEKAAEVEQKIASAKHPVAQTKPPTEGKSR